MNNNNNEKAKPPTHGKSSNVRPSRSSSLHSTNRRLRSNSIGSGSLTSRTVETVSSWNSGSHNSSSQNNNHNQAEQITFPTNFFDEPSASLGFNSITIDKTPRKKTSSSGNSSRSKSNGRSRNKSKGRSKSKSRSQSRNRTSSTTRKASAITSSTVASSSSYPSRGRSRPATSRSASQSHRSRSSSSHGYASASSQRHTSSSTHLKSSQSGIHGPSQRGRSRSATSRTRSSSRHSHSTTRKPSTTSRSSRARSSSKHSTASRTRKRSCSRQSRNSKSDISVSILPEEIEPNVHHDAIMTLEVNGPVIAEMKENELFARKAGINFTKEGGDFLTLVNTISEESLSVPQDEEYLDNIQLSPTHQKNSKDKYSNMLCEDDEFPANATFLRLADSSSSRQLLGNDSGSSRSNQLLGTDQDLAYLRDVAGQLFVKWRGKTSSALARRLRDFQFAQEKRRKKYGNEKPWGILGLYDHLAAVRADIEWAEDAACRRANGEPYKAWFECVDERGTGKNRPFFTYIALLMCTGFLIASIGVNEWKVEPFSVNPMIGPSATTLVIMGAKDSLLIVQGGEVWRLLSAMVLHAGLIHYLLNMLALWFIGSAVEKCHGSMASLLLFVVPAVGGTLMSAIFLPEYITVGASAGIFGLIGACLADICMNWALLFNGFVNGDNRHRHTVVILVLFLDIVVNSLVGLTPFVDNFAHLGGMFFGFLCGTSTMQRVSTDIFGGEQKRTFFTTLKQNVFRFFGIIVTVVSMCTAIALLMNGDGQTSPCPSCDALSCMPFPPWGEYENKWWYCDDCGSVGAEARINPSTSEFDQLTIECPGGDTATLNFSDHDFETDRSWLESRLPQLCRKHCPQVHFDY